jgi:uncharacterized membrane protein
MSKHKIYRTETPPKPSQIPAHPIWRGIGCILSVFIPLISYFVASGLINNRGKISWLIIPQELIFSQLKDPFLAIKLLYAGILVLIIAIILAFLTFSITRLFGPSKYGPHDIPPEKVTRIGH